MPLFGKCLPLLAAVLLLGCNLSATGARKISGEVQFNEEPLASGEIAFVPAAADGKPYSAKIVGGKFELQARLGAYRVEVRASRLVPGKEGPSGEPLAAEFIPSRFNSESTLAAEVTANGPNRFDFTLR